MIPTLIGIYLFMVAVTFVADLAADPRAFKDSADKAAALIVSFFWPFYLGVKLVALLLIKARL